jgi:hypothetical protein
MKKARTCSACGSDLPKGDESQIFCSLKCQLKRDPIDSLSGEQLDIVRGGMNFIQFSNWRAEMLNNKGAIDGW